MVEREEVAGIRRGHPGVGCAFQGGSGGVVGTFRGLGVVLGLIRDEQVRSVSARSLEKTEL